MDFKLLTVSFVFLSVNSDSCLETEESMFKEQEESIVNCTQTVISSEDPSIHRYDKYRCSYPTL